jgi:hypothetical protein
VAVPDMDPLLAEAICRAYKNRLDDFCQENPKVFFAPRCFPAGTRAIREARIRNCSACTGTGNSSGNMTRRC